MASASANGRTRLPGTWRQRTGTSATSRPNPRATVNSSTSKAYPLSTPKWNRSRPVGARNPLKPHWVSPSPTPVATLTPRAKQRPMTVRTTRVPSARDSAWVREPTATSDCPSAATSWGIWSGSMAMSASMKAVSGARASRTPARTAAPLPAFSARRVTVTWGRVRSRSAARAAVSSPLPSSTTTTSVVAGSTAPAAMARVNRPMPSARRPDSLKAGTTMLRANGATSADPVAGGGPPTGSVDSATVICSHILGSGHSSKQMEPPLRGQGRGVRRPAPRRPVRPSVPAAAARLLRGGRRRGSSAPPPTTAR